MHTLTGGSQRAFLHSFYSPTSCAFASRRRFQSLAFQGSGLDGRSAPAVTGHGCATLRSGLQRLPAAGAGRAGARLVPSTCVLGQSGEFMVCNRLWAPLVSTAARCQPVALCAERGEAAVKLSDVSALAAQVPRMGGLLRRAPRGKRRARRAQRHAALQGSGGKPVAGVGGARPAARLAPACLCTALPPGLALSHPSLGQPASFSEDVQGVRPKAYAPVEASCHARIRLSSTCPVLATTQACV
jgi:hypothetical protein